MSFSWHVDLVEKVDRGPDVEANLTCQRTSHLPVACLSSGASGDSAGKQSATLDVVRTDRHWSGRLVLHTIGPVGNNHQANSS